MVTPPNVTLPWNDAPADLVNLTVSSGSSISVSDPENELANQIGVGTSSLSWQYSSTSTNPNRFPENQDWSINALDINSFEFDVNTSSGSGSLTTANFSVVTPVPFEPSPTLGLFVLGGIHSINILRKKLRGK